MDSNSILKRFKNIEEEVEKLKSEKVRLQLEKENIKNKINEKIQELREMGITFDSKEELKETYEDLKNNLESSIKSLERKLEEYKNLN